MHFPDFTVLASISLYMIISFWEGQANSPVMSQANTILINHVIASIQSNSLHCMQACATTSNCYSINQYPGCGRCELNSATHLSHPWDMVSDADGSYMIYNLRLYICSYSLCQDDKMCELNADGLTHNCKAKYFDIYVRSETADDPRRTPGTIGISSIVVDGREYASGKKGWNIAAFFMNGTHHSNAVFDTDVIASHRPAMLDYLNNLPNNTLVVVTVQANGFDAEIIEPALRNIGAQDPAIAGWRMAWCLVGHKGGNQPWIRQAHSTTDITEISVKVP